MKDYIIASEIDTITISAKNIMQALLIYGSMFDDEVTAVISVDAIIKTVGSNLMAAPIGLS